MFFSLVRRVEIPPSVDLLWEETLFLLRVYASCVRGLVLQHDIVAPAAQDRAAHILQYISLHMRPFVMPCIREIRERLDVSDPRCVVYGSLVGIHGFLPGLHWNLLCALAFHYSDVQRLVCAISVPTRRVNVLTQGTDVRHCRLWKRSTSHRSGLTSGNRCVRDMSVLLRLRS